MWRAERNVDASHLSVCDEKTSLALFGFSSIQELETFQILLGISGIGPKAALSVLSTMSVEDLYYAVFSEDAKSIAKTPGIGPKGCEENDHRAERQAESRRFRVSFRGRGSSATEFLYRRRQHCGYCTGISSIRLFEWRSISCRT
ncbi:MAG: helix-hairpin-helix domain-containing protein [Anaerobutyricum soehngenii]